ncbi:MAG: hypothetical protein R2710_14580 [Acidimicrobiales bacterium]
MLHEALGADRIAAEYANIVAPSASVTVGARQTGVSAAWSVTTSQSRSGSNAAAAPSVVPGTADAWLTAIGIDEPGIEFRSWWWMTTTTGVDLAAGTRTGDAPTDQYETALGGGGGWDLATLVGSNRTGFAPPGGTPATGRWVEVVLRTDDTGVSSVTIDGVEAIGPTALGLVLDQGSFGWRVGELGAGEAFNIDDARARKLVAVEPTTSLGALDRN